jgi:hypothetical protein
MLTPLDQLYPSEPTAREDVLPALRQLFDQHRAMTQSGSETLSRALHVLCYLPYRPEPFAVEVALEALRVEGEIASTRAISYRKPRTPIS